MSPLFRRGDGGGVGVGGVVRGGGAGVVAGVAGVVVVVETRTETLLMYYVKKFK